MVKNRSLYSTKSHCTKIDVVHYNVPLCMHDLESRHDLRKGYATVVLPFPERLRTLDKDDEGVVLAVEDDFGLGAVAARHVDDLFGLWGEKRDGVVSASGVLLISVGKGPVVDEVAGIKLFNSVTGRRCSFRGSLNCITRVGFS
jgi:hypothetical protein